MCLDFSEFHPLDHWAGDSYCRSLPGGFKRHIALWNEYQSPDPIGSLFCKIGRHEPTDFWIRKPLESFNDEREADGQMCYRCYLTLEEY